GLSITVSSGPRVLSYELGQLEAHSSKLFYILLCILFCYLPFLKRTAAISCLFSFFFLLFAGSALAQYKVKGTVYDSSRHYRIEAVTVMSTGGRMTMTDTLGHYEIA